MVGGLWAWVWAWLGVIWLAHARAWLPTTGDWDDIALSRRAGHGKGRDHDGTTPKGVSRAGDGIGERSGATDSGAAPWLTARCWYGEAFGLARETRISSSGPWHRDVSWAGDGPCPCAAFSSRMAFLHARRRAHSPARTAGHMGPRRKKDRPHRQCASHTGRPITTAPSRPPINHASLALLHLTPGLGCPAASVSSHAPQPRQEEKRMHTHHARGTSGAHAYGVHITSASACAPLVVACTW